MVLQFHQGVCVDAERRIFMASIRSYVLIHVIFLSFVTSLGWAEAPIDVKVTKCFKVNWSSIDYFKMNKIQRTSPKKQETSENLSLSCEIEILKPDLILGTTQECVLTQLIDSNGKNVSSIPAGHSKLDVKRMDYEALRYRRRRVPPARPNRWLARIQSILKIPRRTRPQPTWVNELEPNRMHIKLDANAGKHTGEEISRIEGYFYALKADSLEHIEVPFEPNNNWVRLTDDLEIRVREARHTGSSYHFQIENRHPRGVRIRSISPKDLLPSRIVVNRQLIGPNDKPAQHFRSIRRLPAQVGGSGSGSGGSSDQIQKIRFVIAVNPSHYKVPFKFEHIPLPKP